LNPFDLDSGVRGEPATCVEELRRQVDADDAAACLRGPQCCVARATGDVEDVLARRDPDRPDDPGPDLPQRQLGDRREVPCRPRGAGALLELCELRER